MLAEDQEWALVGGQEWGLAEVPEGAQAGDRTPIRTPGIEAGEEGQQKIISDVREEEDDKLVMQ